MDPEDIRARNLKLARGVELAQDQLFFADTDKLLDQGAVFIPNRLLHNEDKVLFF